MSQRSGIVTLAGRPNAGKSTLLNRILREKLAIVSDKPQTTRHRLLGLLSDERGQMVLTDTPGVHKPKHRMNRRMVEVALEAIRDADVVCAIVDASTPFGSGDAHLIELLKASSAPKVVVLNKIDLVAKPQLLPLIERYAASGVSDEVVPVSALRNDGVDHLLEVLWGLLPEGEPLYDPELLTIHPERFLVAERIREKVLERTREELPYATAVRIDSWNESDGGLLIHASILVERESQKRIVIGKQGQMIRSIGTAARLDLEEFLGRRLYLDLQVRCVPGWREESRILDQLELDTRVPIDEPL